MSCWLSNLRTLRDQSLETPGSFEKKTDRRTCPPTSSLQHPVADHLYRMGAGASRFHAAQYDEWLELLARCAKLSAARRRISDRLLSSPMNGI